MRNKALTSLLIFGSIIFVVLGCSFNKAKDIEQLLRSNELSDKMEAYYQIGENRDSSYIDLLIINLNDPRLSNNMKFKGMSIYQCKMVALKKISLKTPPHPISYRPDNTNIRFYLQWAKQRK